MRHSTEKRAEMPLIWDVPVRLFHWLLVFFVSLSVISAEIGTLDAMDIHFYSGYAILSLLLFRLFWGFLGTPYARFSSFIRTPFTVYTYLRSWFSRTETSTKAYAGHNPAGGYMIVLMLGLLLAQATTGLFADDDIFTSGPLVHLVSDALSNRLTSLHHLISKFILAAVALHIIVIALYERYKKRASRRCHVARQKGACGGRHPQQPPQACHSHATIERAFSGGFAHSALKRSWQALQV